FGGETSTNVANYYTAGLKGRWQEERRKDDHLLTEAATTVQQVVDGRLADVRLPALTALNADLRAEYIADCATGLTRWNRILDGVATLYLPHVGFNRQVGAFAGHHLTPDGRLVDRAAWERDRDRWLPTPA